MEDTSKNEVIAVGDCALLKELPEWVGDLPSNSQQVFQFCVGRAYPVIEIDQNGLYVLDVSQNVDDRFGGYMNDIRVERHYLGKAPCTD